MKQEELNLIEPDTIIDGIHTVLSNANNLISDADILFKEKRFPRAYALYQLAIEEIGKSLLLFRLLLSIKEGETIDYNHYNKQFINHKKKSKTAIDFESFMLLLMFQSEKNIDRRNEIKTAFQDLINEENNLEQLNNNKNFSLYVSIVKNSFVSPEQFISEEMASRLQTNAQIRINVSTQLFDFIFKNLNELIISLKKLKNDTNFKPNKDFEELILSPIYND